MCVAHASLHSDDCLQGQGHALQLLHQFLSCRAHLVGAIEVDAMYVEQVALAWVVTSAVDNSISEVSQQQLPSLCSAMPLTLSNSVRITDAECNIRPTLVRQDSTAMAAFTGIYVAQVCHQDHAWLRILRQSVLDGGGHANDFDNQLYGAHKRIAMLLIRRSSNMLLQAAQELVTYLADRNTLSSEYSCTGLPSYALMQPSCPSAWNRTPSKMLAPIGPLQPPPHGLLPLFAALHIAKVFKTHWLLPLLNVHLVAWGMLNIVPVAPPDTVPVTQSQCQT